MRLSYLAFDHGGREIRDSIEAASALEATDLLRRRGLFVTEIDGQHDSGASSPVRADTPRRVRGTRGLKNIAMFTRQLYVLLSTGTPLTDALGALERQSRDRAFGAVIADLRRQVEQGEPLSEAMAAHPGCFDPIYRNLIAAGESSGKFEPILQRLSELVRKRLQTRSTVTGALLYPALLLSISAVVLTLMLIFVLPRFSGLFETLDVPLPPTTRALMLVSGLLRGYWWALLGAGGALAFGAWWYVRTAAGREAAATAMIRLPLIGTMTRGFITARIARLLGVLLDSHLPLLEALHLSRNAAGNIHYQRLLDRTADTVERGEPMSSALRDDRLVNPSIQEAIRSGESTGRLSDMLLNMAGFMDEENEMRLRAMTSLLEPVILVGLGLLVGLVALSMFLPLFDLTAMAGGQ